MDIEHDRDQEEFFDNCVESGRLPSNDALKQLVLERLVREFEEQRIYDKAAVNDSLHPFFDDYVLVGRELVNFGYLSYDNTANTYEVRKTELPESDYRSNTRLERHAKDLGWLD